MLFTIVVLKGAACAPPLAQGLGSPHMCQMAALDRSWLSLAVRWRGETRPGPELYLTGMLFHLPTK